jgi:DNA-directed RNA polymerase subunit RPC12/RpoP
MRFRRPLLGLVLGAIAVTAALGLYAVLVPGEFGETQAKVLGTSAAISVTSVILLAFVPAWERDLVLPLPLGGSILSVGAFALGMVMMWSDLPGDTYGKVEGTTIFLAAWALVVSLLALATLPSRYRWAFVAAAVLTFTLATVGIASMWAEPDSEAVGRLAGALAVLSAAFVLSVPVLHRASRGELAAAPEKLAAGYCPRCGNRVAGAATDEPVTCGRCGARFLVSYIGSVSSDRRSPVGSPDARSASVDTGGQKRSIRSRRATEASGRQ